MSEKKWFAIHILTGCEQKVVTGLRSRAETAGMSECIGQVLVPTEKVSEVKEGKKKISERKFFPGYILVEMDLTDESWYLVKNTPGVTGFVGSGNKPLPLPESEIKNIIDTQTEKATKPKPKVDFAVGESVRVKEGAFANFNGTIEELNPNKGKLRVMVTIFGRQTPVELEYWQVEKL